VTGAVAAAALVGRACLLAGVALGWYLRRNNDWCPSCGRHLTCDDCGQASGEMLKLSRNTLAGS
jgi:hypothetical protein